MPNLIKDGALAEDQWQLITSSEESNSSLPSGKIILPLAQWLTVKDSLGERISEVGVWLNSDEFADSISDNAKDLPLIALNFPVFADGRCFSTAHLLRERYKFTGELRAIGNVIRDQMFYLKRCGVNSFSFNDDIDAEAALASLNDFTESYQASANQAQPLFKRRA
jgi:uncharacterized protein (DUF934 family)